MKARGDIAAGRIMAGDVIELPDGGGWVNVIDVRRHGNMVHVEYPGGVYALHNLRRITVDRDEREP